MQQPLTEAGPGYHLSRQVVDKDQQPHGQVADEIHQLRPPFLWLHQMGHNLIDKQYAGSQ